MKRIFQRTVLLLLAAVLLLSTLPGCASPEEHTAYYFDYFDTFSYFTAYTASSEEFTRYEALVHEELASWHTLLNGFSHDASDSVTSASDDTALSSLNPSDSAVLTASNLAELNALAGQGPIEVPEKLFSVLQYGKEAWDVSHHTINITLGSVTRLWKEQQESEHPQVPSPEVLENAARSTEISELVLDEEALCITLPQGMLLDVGAIAKGYVAGKIRSRLLEAGCRHFLLSLGGNILCEGAPPRREGWLVGIANPRYEEGTSESNLLESVTLKNASLVTSGDYERFFEADGVRYHHIIDPQTLFPGTRYCSVTICCADAVLADLLSTTLFLLPMDEGKELTATLCQGEWSLVYVDLDGTVTHLHS